MIRFLATAAPLVLCSLIPAEVTAQQQPGPEERLREMGLSLPTASPPVGNYVRAVRSGNLVFLSGHGECSEPLRGKVGRDVTLEQAYDSARNTGLCLLATLKGAIGDLGKVSRIVKVLGMVNSVETFTDQPKVINGFSDLMVAVFGERGRHARSAVGMAALPNNITVEIEMVVEILP